MIKIADAANAGRLKTKLSREAVKFGLRCFVCGLSPAFVTDEFNAGVYFAK